MAENKSALEKVGEFVGHAFNIAGVAPAGVVAIVTSALAVFAGWPAPLIMIAGLMAALLAFALVRIIPQAWLAYLVVGVIVGVGMLVAWHQYNDFKIEAAEVRVGLVPSDLTYTKAAGVRVSMTFSNTNDFPIWAMSDRRITSVTTASGILISRSEQKPMTFEREKNSVFGIADEQINFPAPTALNNFIGGTVDYHLCYGRSKRHMDKELTVKGKYWPELIGNNQFNIRWDPTEYKEGRCG